MKVEKYYDIKCDICGRYLSTDFNKGMWPTRESCIAAAKRIGFKNTAAGTVCPICQEHENIDKR